MNRKKLLLLTVFVAAAVLIYAFNLHQYLTLESFRANRAALFEFYQTHPLITIAAFIIIYTMQTALFLPTDIYLSLLSGALFGVTLGTIFANIGATTGSVLGFLAVRYVFSDFVQKRFGSRLEEINKELERDGLQYLIALRLIPIFPFVLITLGAALTRMSLRNFSLGTMLGIIPGGILFCNAGASLAQINSTSDIISPRMLVSLFLLGLFSLLPVLYRRQKLKRRERGTP